MVFLTHHGTGDWAGRQVSLLPVTWVNEWPIIGKVLPEGIGTMVWTGKMPKEILTLAIILHEVMILILLHYIVNGNGIISLVKKCIL